MGIEPASHLVYNRNFLKECFAITCDREMKKICRLQAPSLYSRFFKCWKWFFWVCLFVRVLPVVTRGVTLMCPVCIQAWVIGEEAKWIYSQSKWCSGKSGQMACLNLRCPHCGKDDQLRRRCGWAIKYVTIWLPFTIGMENYVVSSPQTLWDFLWGWPPEGIRPTLVTLII